MKLRTTLVVFVFVALATGCEQNTPTDLVVAPQFAKPGACPEHPSCKDGDAYQFRYAPAEEGLVSDCVKMSPESTYGKTFWCYGEAPTFVLKVVSASGEPVTGGIVTFHRCTDFRDNSVQPWTKCGVLQRKNKRHYGGVYYGESTVGLDGLFALTLDATWDPDRLDGSVWGMHWEYDDGSGKRPEAGIKWTDLAHVDHMNPPPE
jgi:hypothetical protein